MTNTCTSPPELTELQISMFLDGETDVQVEMHLDQCAHCRERAQELARAQNALRSLLYRAHCPTSDELRDYHFGLLDNAKLMVVEDHLQRCPHCTHHLAELNQFVSAEAAWTEIVPEPSAGPLQRIRQVVAELLTGGPGPGAPILAGVRGMNAPENLIYQAEDILITIDIQDDPERPNRKEMVGYISDVETEGRTINLWQAHRLMASAAVDKMGNFVIANVLPATYDVIVSAPDVTIRIAGVPAGE